MAFKEVSDLSADTTIALGGFNKKAKKDNPTQVEGYYLGNRSIPDRKKKNGMSYLHFFQTSSGNVGVWGKTDMDRKLLAVTPGTMTRVTFDRMVDTPNGEMYKYKVAVDSDNTIEVASTNLSTGSGANSGTTTGETWHDEGDEEEEEETRSTQDSASSAREARVKELLNRGKTKAAQQT